MAPSRDRNIDRPNFKRGQVRRSIPDRLSEPSGEGAEAMELRSLVDSRAQVTVTLKSGEQLRGRIRYYDRDCFSLRVAGGGPKLFLRKSSVLQIQED